MPSISGRPSAVYPFTRLPWTSAESSISIRRGAALHSAPHRATTDLPPSRRETGPLSNRDRREEYSAQAFRVELENAGDELWAQAVYRVPATKEARNLAKRFEKHGEAYLRFITTPGVEPTNNLAEQAIRFVVIDRHITQGSRSEGGRRWLERIWTTMATCAQQGRSAFEFLAEAVEAHFQGAATPRLLPDTS